MRNAKKIALLLLSLVLLVGIFAVATLAEEQATTATVLYPDGSTATVEVGQSITPKAVTDGLYYGEGNTLFKDDSTEGWSFRVEGASAALTDLTVTADMAGKTILAEGFDKVYFTTKEELSTGTTMVYHLTDDLGAYFTSANTGDDGKGIHTGAASYATLCTKGVPQKLTVTVYSDTDCSDFRPCLTNAVDRIPLLFDLNGHTLRYETANASNAGIDGVKLYLYSSKQNAHLYVAKGTLITVDDLATVYLGEDDTSNTDYADNIHFHCQSVLGRNYGYGASIYGGHYHQLPGSTDKAFVSLNRRVYTVKNATFYVLDGYSVFHDLASESHFGGAATGDAIDKCTFYSQGKVGVTHGVNGINTKFTNCTFYGFTAANAGTEGKGTVTATEAAGNVFKNAVTYSTVTWHDGTTLTYYAANLDAAKAFVARLPQAILPYNVEKDGGLYRYLNPAKEFAFDENLNAVATEVSEATKIAWSYCIKDAEFYVTYVADGSKLNAFLTAMEYNVKIKLWEDISAGTNIIAGRESMETTSTGAYAAMVASYWLDLNGHTLTMTTSSSTIESVAFNFTVYSSVPGGVWSIPNASSAFYTNNSDYKIIDGVRYAYGSSAYTAATSITPNKPSGNFRIGEETPSSTTPGPYGKNLTVICQSLTGTPYGNGVYIYGGTFVQAEKGAADVFLRYTQRTTVAHATFVITKTNTVPVDVHANMKAFPNCTFVYEGNGSKALTASAVAGTFSNCNFVNIAPSYSAAHVYTDCTFGTTSYYPGEDLDASDASAVYLAHGKTTKEIIANGKTYVLDGTLVFDLSSVLVLTHENLGTEYWMVGTFTPLRDAGSAVKIEDGKMYADAYYNYAAVDKIDAATGEIRSAGVATVALAYNTVDQAAFTYRDLATGALYGVGYEACGSTGTGVFEKFYELFNAPDAGYEIVMYVDMTVTKGMGFGPVVLDRTTDAHNRDYFNSLANGSIIWDLNGTTVTIDKAVKDCVKTGAANCALDTSGAGPTYGGNVVFGFEGYNTVNSFTLKSSQAGGRIENLSSMHVFAVGEGKKTQLIIQGENLTVDAGGGLAIASHELDYNLNQLTDRHQILGGTFISSNATGVLQISMNTTIRDAILISTNPKAKAVVYMDSYRSGRVQANNVTFIAESTVVPIFSMGTSGSGKYTLQIADCTIAGAAPAVVTSRITAVTYSGANTAANAADLAVVNPSAPAGAVAAYTSVSANGEYYKTCGYFDADHGFVTINNEFADFTEVWAVGAKLVFAGDVSSLQVLETDGVWYFRENPVWIGMIGGEVVDDILAAENAGKTVSLTVGGDVAPLYFTHTINGGTVYYYGDAAAVNSELIAILKAMGAINSTITFYSDFTINSSATINVDLGGKTHIIDLNGYTVTLTGASNSYPTKYANGSLYIYSSREGGVLDASTGVSFWMTDNSGNIYLGEPNNSSTAYGKNFTLICKSMNSSRLWSTNGYILGGTYVQPEGASATYFLSQGNAGNGDILIRNATFILNNITGAWMAGGCEHNGVIENVTIIAKNQTALFAPMSGANKNITFQNCYFYNVTPTLIPDVTYTYENCAFNKLYDAQANGVLAYTDKIVLTVNGTDYVFNTTVAAADQVATVNWGFGIIEPWVIGVTATHANAVIDGAFGYSFLPLTVEAGENKAEAKFVDIKSGILNMSLSLQSSIIFNIGVNEALANAIVTIGGKAIELGEAKNGFFALKYAVAPNVADKNVLITITIGDNTHEINVSVGDYAAKILSSEDEKLVAAKNVTYAMVEYVRVMANNADFLKDVAAPAGYEAKVLAAEASGNEGTLLENIAFQLDGTIAIAVQGENAVGKEVVLTLATGRIERATVGESGIVIFENLYVNEFNGVMTLTVEDEAYTYSLANYLYGIGGESAAVQALYNYVAFAQEYVEILKANLK